MRADVPTATASSQLSETSGGATQKLSSDGTKSDWMRHLIPEASDIEGIQAQIRKNTIKPTRQSLRRQLYQQMLLLFVRKHKEASRRAVSLLNPFVLTFENEQLDTNIHHNYATIRTLRACFCFPFFYTRYNQASMKRHKSQVFFLRH